MSADESESQQTEFPRFLRIPGPSARETEERVAQHIEAMIAQYDRRHLGPRTRRDGTGGLRVDFTFDEAAPPVAFEVTALAAPQGMALGAELIQLEAELREIACTERLGKWMLGIRVGTKRAQPQVASNRLAARPPR